MQQSDSENNKKAIDFKYSDVQEDEKDITKESSIERFNKDSLSEKIFQTCNWIIVWLLQYFNSRELKKY